MKGPCAAGKGTVDLLMTHFHWDHLIGLPFFGPIFVPGNIINVYAVQPDLEKVFQDLFKKPYFPVPFSGIGGTVRFHRLEPRKSVRFGELEVTPYQLDHPDPCWGYQFKAGGKVYSHCVDTECVRVGQEELGEDLPLYQGVDLMTFDAQYTLQESLDRVNWGHAAAGLGLDIAMREGIKRILFMHHDPASSDERISQVEAQTRIYYNKQVKTLKGRDLPFFEVNWEFAREGMVVEL
jgi:phosphoribosyl 1,2-cyclic phosphodiesterase